MRVTDTMLTYEAKKWDRPYLLSFYCGSIFTFFQFFTYYKLFQITTRTQAFSPYFATCEYPQQMLVYQLKGKLQRWKVLLWRDQKATASFTQDTRLETFP